MAKKTTTTKKSSVSKKTVTKKVPAKKSAAKKSTVKKVTPSTKGVAIRVLTDVGFGNHLFIRGEGKGLSWDVGQPMQCAESSEWTWTSPTDVRPVQFKVLINDHVWSVGDDFVAYPGSDTVIEPAF